MIIWQFAEYLFGIIICLLLLATLLAVLKGMYRAFIGRK